MEEIIYPAYDDETGYHPRNAKEIEKFYKLYIIFSKEAYTEPSKFIENHNGMEKSHPGDGNFFIDDSIDDSGMELMKLQSTLEAIFATTF